MMGITNPENIVGIPEWVARYTEFKYDVDAIREEGYNQAMDDLLKRWHKIPLRYLTGADCMLFHTTLFQALHDGKKARFHPEPPKPDLSGISTDDLADELFRRGITE